MSSPRQHSIPDLDESILAPDPIQQFRMWFDAARTAKLPHADAMVVATATNDGQPSARVVLLKLVDDRGIVFHTNYNSRKGEELSANPRAALVSHWPEFNRQVRVEGAVTKLSADESDAYFATRPRESQLSSMTSAQSEAIVSRAELDQRFENLKRQYEGKHIPRPSHWGGYRVHPDRMEFWQSRFARLNDRILYTRQPNGAWTRTRLQP